MDSFWKGPQGASGIWPRERRAKWVSYLFPLSTSVTGGRFEGTNKNNVFNQTISGKGKKKFQGLGMIPLYSYQGAQESLGEEKIRK